MRFWFPLLLLVLLPLLLTGSLAQGTYVPLSYDVQIGETFPYNSTSLSVTVTAVPQTGLSGDGPAYLLNGLTDAGWWYQIGISYDWPSSSGHANGFKMNYEVFNPQGTSVYPMYGGGVQGFTGTVRPGDNVTLSLSMVNGLVVMTALDLETGARAVQTYVAKGSRFVGMSNSSSNSKGFFTGIMTEWYRASLNLSEAPVRYVFSRVSSAVLWITVTGTGVNSSPLIQVTKADFSSSTPMLCSEVRLGNGQERALPNMDVTGSGLNVSLRAHPLLVDYGIRTLTVELNASGSAAGSPVIYHLYGNSTQLASLESVSGATLSIKLNATKRLILYADAVSGSMIGGSPPAFLLVNPDPSISIEGARLYDVGELPRINVTVTGGTPPYAFSFGLDGRELKNLTVPLDTLGANLLTVGVRDATGVAANSSFKLYVSPDPEVVLSSDENESEVGYPIALTVSVINGTAPYAISMFMNGSYVSNSAEFSYDPPAPGTYQFVAKVVDSTGYGALSYPVDVIVRPRLGVSVDVNLSGSLLVSNSSLVARVRETGGLPPFKITWYVNGKALQSGSSAVYKGPMGMGTNNLTVVVADSLGVTSALSLTVRSDYNYVGLALVAALAVGVGLLFYAVVRRRRAFVWRFPIILKSTSLNCRYEQESEPQGRSQRHPEGAEGKRQQASHSRRCRHFRFGSGAKADT
ncbi:hypothetical protein PQ610_06230 [Tardisphaera miroshnichenkoae]